MDTAHDTHYGTRLYVEGSDALGMNSSSPAPELSELQTPDKNSTSLSASEQPTSQDLPTEQEPEWLGIRVGFQWPASRLTERDRRMLTRVSNHVKRPMNQVLQEAVQHYAAHLLPDVYGDNARNDG